jgi:hypothetical protein
MRHALSTVLPIGYCWYSVPGSTGTCIASDATVLGQHWDTDSCIAKCYVIGMINILTINLEPGMRGMLAATAGSGGGGGGTCVAASVANTSTTRLATQLHKCTIVAIMMMMMMMVLTLRH